VRTAEGPTSLEPADEVIAAWAERIYYDKAHRQLAYTRHVVVSRTERVVTYVEYAFLLVPADPQAKVVRPGREAGLDPAGQGDEADAQLSSEITARRASPGGG